MRYAFILGAVLLAVICIYYGSTDKFETSNEVKNEFIIDKPFKEVVLKLAKEDIFEDIITANGGKILERKQKTEFHIDKILKPDWHIDGYGVYLVEFPHPYKRIRVTLHEQMQSRKNSLETSTFTTGKDISYQSIIKILPDGDKKTKVSTLNYIRIKERVPRSWQENLKNEVIENNEKARKNTEACIRKACDTGLFTITLDK